MISGLLDQLGGLFEDASLGVVALDQSGRIALANPTLEAIFGYAPGELLGQPLELLLPESMRSAHLAHRADYGAETRPAAMGHGRDLYGRRKDGRLVPIEARLSRIMHDGQLVPVAFVIDVTERRRIERERDDLLRQERQARAAAEAAQRRQAFLDEASRLLASSLDFETTLAHLAQVAVPFLGDCCLVDLLAGDGIQHVATAHVVPEKEALLREFRGGYHPSLNGAEPMPLVLRTGRPVLESEVDERVMERAAYNPAHLRLMREIGLKSALNAPIVLRGRTLGALALLVSESDRRYGPDDLALAQELALLAAQAIENARLLREAQEETRRKEEALALLDTLLQSAPIGFAFLDRDLRYQMINGRLADMNGAAPEAHIGRGVADIIPQLGPSLDPVLRRVRDTGEPALNLELSAPAAWAPDELSHWLASYYPVRLRDEVLGVGGVVSEITEIKRAEQALRASEERFRATFEQAPIGIAHIAPSGQLLRVNQRLCDIVGYTSAELIERSLHDITAPSQAFEAQGRIGRLLTNEIASYTNEWRYARADGTGIWLSMTVSLVRDEAGAPSYFIAMIEDITERRQAEENRARLAAIVDSSEEAIIGKALDGTILSWNASAQRIFGYAAEEMIGQSIARLLPFDRQDEEEAILARIRAGERIAHFESARVHKDGRSIDVALTVSPIRDAAGNIIGASKIARDITEQKSIERALRQQATFMRLLQAVAIASNQAMTLEAALQTALDQICEHVGWPVGHAFVASEGGSHVLKSTDIWHMDDPARFATFRAISDAIDHASDGDLPTRVLLSGKPEWSADVTAICAGPRTKLISDIGVRASFGVPVLVGAEVAAVLEFFSTEASAPDEPLLNVMSHIGAQLGRVVERARSTASVRASEERFRLLAEHASDVVLHYRVAPAPGFEFVSSSCATLYGYAPEEHYADASLLMRIVDRADHRLLRALIESPADNQRLELRAIHKNGARLWLELHTTPICDDAGKLLGLHAIMRDITERKRVEEALRSAEERHRALVEQVPAIVYTAELDERSSTSYVSPQIERILGFSPAEWLADPELWLKQVHPDDRAIVMETIERTRVSEEPILLEYRSITRDGRVVWLQDTSRIVRDEAGRALFMQGITLDITERKRAEEELRRSEWLYRTLARNFPNGAVMLFDHDLRYTVADGAGLSDLGIRSREAVEGRTIWEVHSLEWCEMFEPYLRGALRGTPFVLEAPYGDRLADQLNVFHVLPVRDDHGQIIAGMIMTQDITERRRIEQALIEERALLARRVEERTADLSAANAELARAVRLKDEFLASMSHELRTPLNAVLGLSEALREEAYGPLGEQQERALSTIEESGRHLLELINDILDLAKIGAGKLDLDVEPVDASPICQASLRLIRQAAQKKQISVASSIDPPDARLPADARRLKQVLVNLLSNAVKFTPERGAIGLEVRGNELLHTISFTVWDTGIGIAGEHFERLFQPFVQLDSRLARQYEGTGLGLALVYRIVELHGGSVAVDSTVGAGSRFIVTLPWPDAAGTTTGLAHSASPPSASAARRALIVDDSPSAAGLAAYHLQKLGVVSEVLDRGAPVLARAREARPDLIVLDIQLPDMSGLDVLAQLKGDPRTRDIPVAIVSNEADQVEAPDTGAAAYLTKPCTRADFQRLLGEPPAAEHMVNGNAHTAASTILLAEDNETNIVMIGDYLRLLGYQLIVARNGAEALARARETPPELILMDIQMPGMDGLEATRRIRAESRLTEIPIVALTALAMPGDREKCMAAGANDYLSKPISLKRLAATIDAHLRRAYQDRRNLP